MTRLTTRISPPDRLGRLPSYGTGLLILTIGAVLAMLILPLPPFLLDFLFAINLLASLILLLVAISIPHNLRIAAFPTLVLFSTLFRLGLNLSSARSILGHAEAGRIVATLGQFATSGNLPVGLVIFAILTLIQFVVIAKGAERVAEVAARFSLDALPGKQISIDADLRAGMIGPEEARQARENLQRESRMYGAMDGAMKFVKGDALAGILITLVNLFGGFSIGVLQRGLAWNQAAHRYALLSIGDALVNQVSALLVAITAGIIVTRVTDSRNEHSLGKDISLQVLSEPQVLWIAAGLALIIGAIPGIPTLWFVLLAALLAGAAAYLMVQLRRPEPEAPVESYLLKPEIPRRENLQAVPLCLEVGPELYQRFREDPRWVHCFGPLYARLRLHLGQQLGLIFPELHLVLNPKWPEGFRYRIRIFDLPVESGLVQLQAQGGERFAPEERLLRQVAKILKRHAGEFIGIQEVHDLLEMVERSYPELVREIVPKRISLQKLSDVVRRLAEENVPIKDFRLILETIGGLQVEDKDPVQLTEQIRMGLKRTLSFLHADSGRLEAYTVAPEIEQEIRQAIRQNGSENYLVLPPPRVKILAEAFRRGLDPARARGILLTQADIRRYLKKLIEIEWPHLPVLSFQELEAGLRVKHLGMLSELPEEVTVMA